MPVYTVHAPIAESAEATRVAERFVFVRDGFHFWAFLLGPLWLAWHRLWLALIGYIVAIAAIELVLLQLRAGSGTRFMAVFLIALFVGFEGGGLRGWALLRRERRQLGIVIFDHAG